MTTVVEDYCTNCRAKAGLVECDVCAAQFCCSCPVCEAIALNASEDFALRVLGQDWRSRLNPSWWDTKRAMLASR
jgi:hypothetical protein